MQHGFETFDQYFLNSKLTAISMSFDFVLAISFDQKLMLN